MSIREVIGKPLGKSIMKDVRRHQEKVMDQVRKHIGDIIANEDIITGDRKRKVRITVRALKDYYFRFAPPKTKAKDGSGKGPGSVAGDEPGEALFDAEFDLDELIDIALEDCGLPNLRQREAFEIEVPKGYRVKSIEKSGLWTLFDKRRTARAAISRITDFIVFLMKETGCTQEEAEIALILSKGDVQKTYQLLLKVKRGEITLPKKMLGKFFLSGDDYRFFELEEELEKVSNAAVYLLRDWSGSTDRYKYLIRMSSSWLSEAIRRLYRNVRIIFIGYENEPERVSENDFFARSASGGTVAYRAYELVQKLIKTETPLDFWDVFVYQFSDGDDFQISTAGLRMEELLKSGVNFVGYGEMTDRDTKSASGTLMTEFEQRFSLKIISGEGHKIYHSKNRPFRGMVFGDKKHLRILVTTFLPKELKEEV
ncbi:MAG: hypothetical protein A3J46_04850 [Candidatus Yanofskybacteria bacterium RIFCSPHIGHO2_02_FULL_41_11]|uniref:Uncharacterized protein n=1 Tax=Candidatus Yanofskybacteria bacterium RIFCSPHIGHO2_02_FULL_41_11 TaxID=1802675 RepID=A0A1F8FAS5_9BACT|nr:MAG: hypothetical protein A3J46_04850 [Candidatus Yanofskybacteria bacterium RIFCSPHIGHO2_02_FULL_41_11]